MTPLPPDPVAPGAAGFAVDALQAWEDDHDANVSFTALRWPDLYDAIRDELESGVDSRDVVYMSSWIPEFSEYLLPIGDVIPTGLMVDLPPSSVNAVSWAGDLYGVAYTLSLLTLYYNQEHLEAAGLSRPPANWDELKGYAQTLTQGDQRYGWAGNYAADEGIGGVTSYWMAFLLQAGGVMYGPEGLPVFADQPGVDALQMMIDLMPATEPNSLTDIGIFDTTTRFKQGRVSMMMNWPFMWRDVHDSTTSIVVGSVGNAVLPAGPAGTASVDGSDAWAIPFTVEQPELAMELIAFFLDPEMQKRQLAETGWLPVRLSVLGDPEVQQIATHAAVVREQAMHPYDSFVTPDYRAVTRALGGEIQQALRGEKTAAQAMLDASEAVTAIVARRIGR